jgi:DNA-directed RNA polymerase specialized sigma24 family protein
MLSTLTRRLLAEAVDVGMGEAGLHWREYVEHPDGFKRAARRATDRAKRWLRREKKRRHTEDRAWVDAMALAGAMYGRDDVALPTDAADVPVLVQLELEQLRRLVDALDKPERVVVEARYWHGEPGRNLPWQDVARIVGRGVRTVRETHARALDELRAWMT